MGSCNGTQEEKGGKDLLLKICEEIEATIDETASTTLVTSVAHGAEVGDLVRFGVDDIGTLTGVTEDTFYYVKTVPDADTFSIAASPGGTAITFGATFTNTIEVFKTIGGLRSASVSFALEGVEKTNYGSNQYREYIDGAGIRAMSVSGDGVYNSSANFRTMETNALANLLQCFAFVEIVTGRIYSACFKVTSLETSAEFSGEATFSMSAESSGAITTAQAA